MGLQNVNENIQSNSRGFVVIVTMQGGILFYDYVILMLPNVFWWFFQVLRSKLTERFPEFEIDAIKALILDPRLKAGRYRFPAQVERAVEQITEEAALITVAVAEPPKKMARKESIWDSELAPISSSRTVGAAKSEGMNSAVIVVMLMLFAMMFCTVAEYLAGPQNAARVSCYSRQS